MLLRKARYRRRIAATLMAVMLSNTILPVISYALTSGPTAPEATSFEPIDTTDMVNLQTGDFTYNIPLLEVPGPEGGYPLSLSYHAGIQPNEDASWVGLGWTLNPGAINRNVNGYPDDWYNPSSNSQVYLEAGQTKTFSVGVNVGIANTPATVGADLAFSQDTYRGFGVGMSMSVGKKWSLGNVSINASIGLGITPYGEEYATGGVGIQGAGLSAGIGFSTNFESINAGVSGGIGYSFGGKPGGNNSFNGSLLGASISTGGGKPSMSVGGLSSSVSASEQAGMQTDVFSLSVDIPAYYFNVSLGYSKVRYWIDKSTNIATHGSLHGSGWGEVSETINGNSLTNMVANDIAFDSYSLLEDPEIKNIVDFPDPTQVQGGSFPDFDQYSVNAQGLGGNMRPYLFQGEVLTQNKKDASGNKLVTYYSPAVTNYAPQFRFEGDFSNSYRQNYTTYSNPALNLRIITPPFDGSPVYGNGDGTFGYAGPNKLAGSRHIDIGPAIKPTNATGYVKTDHYSTNMIEGYSITNESGVTYHYGLPAYSYAEENYQEKIRPGGTGPLYLNRGTKSNPYAYTWYLTTITGPDFVDRNSDGKADNGDWGYWINFEYGKWSATYPWRNPSEGFHRDEDNAFQNVSMGKKEVYYLNAIRTRSHIAIFEKDIRQDGKSASPEIFNKNVSGSTNTDYQYPNGLFNVNSSQSLKLSKIYLLNAADAGAVLPTSGSSTAFEPTVSRTVSCGSCDMAENVIDKTDVDAVNRYVLESKAIRIIDFSYDYSLCPKTSNSYNINIPTTKDGKLTLKHLLLRGKGGASVIPPTRFEYELSGTEQIIQNGVTMAPTYFTTTNANFEVGDIIKASTGYLYYGLITKKEPPSAGIYTYRLTNNTYSGGTTTANIQTTKNPPYNKDFYDSWGMYKADADITQIVANENLGRATTIASGRSADAWSLRTVTSPTGGNIKINYESKSYKSVLNDNGNFIVEVTPTNGSSSGSLTKIKFSTSENFDYILNNYNPGDKINFIALYGITDPNLYPFEVVDSRSIFSSIAISSFNQSDRTILTTASFQTLHSSFGYAPYTFVTANFLFGKSFVKPGGGIRVKDVEANDNSGFESSTLYSYQNPTTQIESGTSTYDPIVFDTYNIIGSGSIYDLMRAEYKKRLYKDVHSLLAISREVPPPGVMHEYVKVTSSTKNSGESVTRTIEGSMQYQFEVFRENMIYRNTAVTAPTNNVTSWGTVESHNVAINKFLHSIGSVKRIIQYDKDGKKLSETVNHYLHDGLENLTPANFFAQYKPLLSQFNLQGYLQERFSEVKTVDEQGWTAGSQVKATMSAREDYPSIPLGQTVINYVNGTQTTSQNLAYDFYSGALTKSVETDAYGNRFMTETTPAYRKYSSMGLKVGTATNKNMLTQTAASHTYKVDATNPNTKLGLISAGVTTWSNTVPALDMAGATVVQNTASTGYVWRPQYSYSWMPVSKTTDGLTPIGSFVDFNWTTPASSNANWKKTSDITQYDVYSKALEAMDINSNYIATRMNYQSKKVELSGSPAKYYEIAFSGAEDDNVNQTANGFVKKVDGTVMSTAGVAHTGSKSLKLGVSAKKGFVYSIECNKLTPGRDYMASVWVKPVSGTASDVKLYYDKGAAALGTSVSSGSSTKTSGNWKLINLKINGADIVNNATVINIGCRNDHGSVEAYVDDFRFQPLNAGTAAYVYDGNSGELTHILDNNNLYTRFEYDPSGKLTATYREKLGVGEYKTNEYQTNFGTLTTYSNQAINEYFIKNNCSPGQMGSIHSINVAAGVYTSVISLDDANAKARDYAQTQANSIGSCGTTASLLLRKMVTSSTSYVAYVNGSTYNFPASGGTTFTIAPGTHSISVQVLSGPSVSNTFRLSVPGFADNVISGTSASWSNIIVPYQSTATILIEQ